MTPTKLYRCKICGARIVRRDCVACGIAKKNRKGFYGTAKIIDNVTSQTTDLEYRVRDALHGTQQACAFNSRVSIHIVTYSAFRRDPDGTCAKYAIDALVHAGVIHDDSPEFVKAVTHEQIKVASRSEEKTEIVIEAVQ